MALGKNEQIYIVEKFAKWENWRIRYWESLPTETLDNPASAQQAEESKRKPALVMIHGYAAMLEHWRRTFAGLKGRYRLYALDLLGFGGGDKPNGQQVNYSAELWARQIHDFLKHKGEENAIVVGHSLGGMVALELKRRYPEMLSGLVLVDSAGLPNQGQAEREARDQNSRPGARQWINFGDLTFNLIKAPLVGETMAAVLTAPNQLLTKRFLEGAYYNKSKVTPQLIDQFLEPLRQPGASGSYLAVTRHFADFQLPLKPGEIKGPVLIVWGEHDRMMPPDNMLPRWKRLLPQAETFRVAEAAHCPQDERPDLVNPRLMQFIDQVAAGTWQEAKSA